MVNLLANEPEYFCAPWTYSCDSRCMGRFRDWWRELRRELQVAGNEQRMKAREMEESRFAERQARHEAGVYEPPHPGGGF